MSVSSLPVFDGKQNFLNWAHQVSFTFRENGHWKMITGADPKPTAPAADANEDVKRAHVIAREDWDKRNTRAASAIVILLRNDVVTGVRSLHIASEIWKRLHALHTKNSAMHAQKHRQDLYNFKMNGSESIHSMLTRFEEICTWIVSVKPWSKPQGSPLC
jgi:hypothetical protein